VKEKLDVSLLEEAFAKREQKQQYAFAAVRRLIP
jgi:hypothetical protein